MSLSRAADKGQVHFTAVSPPALPRWGVRYLGGVRSGKEQVKAAVCVAYQCGPGRSSTCVTTSGCQKQQNLNKKTQNITVFALEDKCLCITLSASRSRGKVKFLITDETGPTWLLVQNTAQHGRSSLSWCVRNTYVLLSCLQTSFQGLKGLSIPSKTILTCLMRSMSKSPVPPPQSCGAQAGVA